MKRLFRNGARQSISPATFFKFTRQYSSKSILSMNQVSKSFDSKTILDGATLHVARQERVVIVGDNGVGKSTLLKIFSGDIEVDSGEIQCPAKDDIGYLPQELTLFSHENQLVNVGDYLLDQSESLKDFLESNGLEDISALYNDESKMSEFKRAGGYKIFKVLNGLNLDHINLTSKLSHLSGGERNRVALAGILLKEPRLLILDEPTNHLDKTAKRWLRDYLRHYKYAVIMVTHDLDLLRLKKNKVKVLNGKHQLENLNSDYENYKQRAVDSYYKEQDMLYEEEKQIKKIKHKIDKKNRKQGKTGRKNSRKDIWEIKKFRKELKEAQSARSEKELSLDQVNISFPMIPATTGETAISISNLSMSFDSRNIFEDIDARINFGDRITLLGENGVGKSVLLKIIMGEFEPSRGEVSFSNRAVINYLRQDIDDLNMNASIIEEYASAFLEEPLESKMVGELKTRCLFDYSMMDRPIKTLSIGQMRRLQIAKLMSSPCNVLLLDEPSNHMDIFTKKMMVSALSDFTGTILAVSHDEEFLTQVNINTRLILSENTLFYDTNGVSPTLNMT